MDPITLATEGLFGIVFFWAVASWVRRRDSLSRDVVLVFAAMGALFLLGLYQVVIGRPPQALGVAAIILLLGQPALTLRLVAQIHPIPGWVTRAAIAAWIVSAVLILALRATPVVLVGAIATFVLAEAAAAGLLAVAARRRAGGGAIRLWCAAGATALLAFAILALGLGATAGDARQLWSQAARGSALLAAIGYMAAFLPPGFVRRAWQAQTAYAGLQTLLGLSAEGPTGIWSGFLRLARESTGAIGAVLVEGEARQRSITAVDGMPPDLKGSPLLLPAQASGEEPLERALVDRPADPALLAGIAGGARYVRTLELGGTPAAALVLFGSHRSLFRDEDETLLTALGQQAGALVDQRRLAGQLAETVAALRAASQAKSDFIASMSHELRTPLNAILGFSDLMRHEQAEPDGSIRVPLEWVEHIHQGGSHLAELINDVLDLARVEAGRLDLECEAVEILPVVSEVVAGLRPLADRKALAVSVDISSDQHATADRGRLRQILYNLLSNAIKFTPDGGRIIVDSRRLGDEVHLAVEDTGIGIAAEDQATVFDEFRQVGASAGRSDGTGLGLALTRRLLEAHGGRIELTSTLGVGSRFTAVFMSAEPPGEPALDFESVPRAVEPTPIGARTVLVVEDEPGAARLLRAYLEPAGYRVRVASDGIQAFQIAAAERPAAILLDLLLPGMDGWEVLRRLKASPDLREIPVVIVTVVDEKDVGLALGAADYLVKPIERDALLGSLRRIAQSANVLRRPISVLAIDDEPATLELLEQTLTPAGFEVIRASGGIMGVQLARIHRPDLVVCDLVMPDLDGFGVVAALRADPETANVPIVILTGHTLTAVDKERLNGHVLGILAKGSSAAAGLRAWLAAATA